MKKRPADTIHCRLVVQAFDAYRLIASGEPEASDFQPTSLLRAELANLPELLRLGLSHYRKAEQARAVRVRPGSRIARLRLKPGSRPIYYANTGTAGHVTVWGSAEQLLEAVQEVDG